MPLAVARKRQAYRELAETPHDLAVIVDPQYVGEDRARRVECVKVAVPKQESVPNDRRDRQRVPADDVPAVVERARHCEAGAGEVDGGQLAGGAAHESVRSAGTQVATDDHTFVVDVEGERGRRARTSMAVKSNFVSDADSPRSSNDAAKVGRVIGGATGMS